MPKIRFIFFGTDLFSVDVLTALASRGYIPAAVVTIPDTPARTNGYLLQRSSAARWADAHQIPVLQPENLKDDMARIQIEEYAPTVCIVASYGKIIPQSILDIPARGFLNVHPSLLPKYRGASPLEAQILNEEHPENTGITIMEMDAEMDHGAIVAQKTLDTSYEWPMPAPKLSEILARMGGDMLVDILPQWVLGDISPIPQVHEHATYTKKIVKEDALVSLSDDSETLWRKFLAYQPWPGIFFMHIHAGKEIRVRITDAVYTDGMFTPTCVLPEGKKEMDWGAFQNGYGA